jgi:hypothetical protein
LELRGDLRALAIRTMDAFFVVFANSHCDGKTLVALLAEIFVEGHRGILSIRRHKIEELGARS